MESKAHRSLLDNAPNRVDVVVLNDPRAIRRERIRGSRRTSRPDGISVAAHGDARRVDVDEVKLLPGAGGSWQRFRE